MSEPIETYVKRTIEKVKNGLGSIEGVKPVRATIGFHLSLNHAGNVCSVGECVCQKVDISAEVVL